MSSAHDQETPAVGAGQQGAGQQYVPRPTPGYENTGGYTPGPSGAAVGFTAMAAVFMMLSGMWSFLEGLSAIIKGQFFVTLPDYAFNVSVSGWGWIHLILGIVVFLAGACLFLDMLWARMLGVVLAGFSALANFLYIPYSPVWSIVVIALDVFVIWALLSPRRSYR